MLTYRQPNRKLHYIVAGCRQPLVHAGIDGSNGFGVASVRVVGCPGGSQYDVADSVASGVGSDAGKQIRSK